MYKSDYESLGNRQFLGHLPDMKIETIDTESKYTQGPRHMKNSNYKPLYMQINYVSIIRKDA